jgi:hypothetical protein
LAKNFPGEKEVVSFLIEDFARNVEHQCMTVHAWVHMTAISKSRAAQDSKVFSSDVDGSMFDPEFAGSLPALFAAEKGCRKGDG